MNITGRPDRPLPRQFLCWRLRALRKRGGFSNVSFTLHEGEIIGIAGVIGSGREDLAKCLAGHQPVDAGVLKIRRQASVLPGCP